MVSASTKLVLEKLNLETESRMRFNSLEKDKTKPSEIWQSFELIYLFTYLFTYLCAYLLFLMY